MNFGPVMRGNSLDKSMLTGNCADARGRGHQKMKYGSTKS